MEYLVGAGLALLVSAGANGIGFDRDRGFYAVVLIFIASYYELFAAMVPQATALWPEALAVLLFAGLACAGFRGRPWLLVLGLGLHGLFDLLHPHLITNPGVPTWWAGFCLAYDLTAATYLACLLHWRQVQ